MGSREGYILCVGGILEKRGRREQVVEDIAGDLLLRKLEGHPIPENLIRDEVFRLYYRRYRAFGTKGLSKKEREEEAPESLGPGRTGNDVQTDPAILLLLEEEEQMAHEMWQWAQGELTEEAWHLLEMWAEGLTYREIAEKKGYAGRAGACKAIHGILTRLRKEIGLRL